MPTVTGFSHPPVPVGVCRFIVMLMALVFLSACAPSNQAEEELRKEIQALKAQVTAMQEKLNQVQTGSAGHFGPAEAAGARGGAHSSHGGSHGRAEPTPAPDALTVAELLASKDRYLGTRVKVKGMPGPVMVHHKSLMLKGPQGMVEVLFGNLPDPKLIQSLSSAALDKPLTVTGVVNLPPARGAGAQLQINAEAVEF